MTRNIILKAKKFVDGDGLIAEDYLTKREFEIRLYGIDAPEMNYCNKIKKDEKELHIPAAFLIKLVSRPEIAIHKKYPNGKT
ncbi:hypothetical protein EKM02_14640 [Flavobacterium sp. RSP49]|uniref:hypothetical protein n=1 Tax=Flavobacterium sp. RSP49 TaxID=2497487 RepID=UPI000F8189D4|nr:hypothetical protein [Flavobacterium sp. RSP49]RTY96896.1 hypothetical protein EKM02_14640 [Flavobacterium sp. RSP49]